MPVLSGEVVKVVLGHAWHQRLRHAAVKQHVRGLQEDPMDKSFLKIYWDPVRSGVGSERCREWTVQGNLRRLHAAGAPKHAVLLGEAN